MLIPMPVLRVTKEQKEFLDREKVRTGNSYASLVRGMIQKAIEEK